MRQLSKLVVKNRFKAGGLKHLSATIVYIIFGWRRIFSDDLNALKARKLLVDSWARSSITMSPNTSKLCEGCQAHQSH